MPAPNSQPDVRIGLDARTMFAPQPRGTGRNLADAYRLLPALRPEWEFVLYHQNPDASARAASAPPAAAVHEDPSGDGTQGAMPALQAGMRGVEGAPDASPPPDSNASLHGGTPPNVRPRYIDIPGDRFGCWLNLRLPWAAWRDGVDLLHLPANAAPLWSPVPYVATIHDLAPLRVPSEYTAAQARRFRGNVRRAARHAVHLIVPSAATRDELCDEFRVDPGRITVVPWAADETIAAAVRSPADRAAAISRVRSVHRLPQTWMLNFSGPSRRKNATGLISALAQLPGSVRSQTCVVLVGCEPSGFRAELLTLAHRLRVGAQVRLLGFVPHGDLPGLIAGARAVLLPSLCEGFGLPILDAFACGVPVLTSALSSMPEVAGAAAIYCDPRAPSSIADGLRSLLDDHVAARLSRAGTERVRRFTWLRTARLMAGVYARCLAGAAERGQRHSRWHSVWHSRPRLCVAAETGAGQPGPAGPHTRRSLTPLRAQT